MSELEIKKNLANPYNYGNKRPLTDIKGIVIHYTSNDGDTDEGNGKYFHNNAVGVSANYFVDSDSVTISVPDEYVAYHCGTKGKYYHPFLRNQNTIGIELCDDIRDGKVDFNDKTINNAVILIRMLMKKYNIPIENVVRHYDITHKICPKPFVDDESRWLAFKKLITNEYELRKIKINLFGKVKECEAVLIDGNNYVKIRDLETKGLLEVGYSEGCITINSKKFIPMDTVLINNLNYIKLRNLDTAGFEIGYDNKCKMPMIAKK